MRIKICGITTIGDAQLAAQLGADAIGLNFYDQSPRVIDATRAKEILQVLPPFVEPVGVLVSPSAHNLRKFTSTLAIRTIQLHATTPAAVASVVASGSTRVIVAHGIRNPESLGELRARLADWLSAGVHPAAVLVDASVPGQHGGTGQPAPWHLLEGFDPGLPLILAGGLTPANVAEAIRVVRPFAVDVASGVERAPGIKDDQKLRKFIDHAREAAERHL